jgi:hypothetical protein
VTVGIPRNLVLLLAYCIVLFWKRINLDDEISGLRAVKKQKFSGSRDKSDHGDWDTIIASV